MAGASVLLKSVLYNNNNWSSGQTLLHLMSLYIGEAAIDVVGVAGGGAGGFSTDGRGRGRLVWWLGLSGC
jgi:hypothetical protein